VAEGWRWPDGIMKRFYLFRRLLLVFLSSVVVPQDSGPRGSNSAGTYASSVATDIDDEASQLFHNEALDQRIEKGAPRRYSYEDGKNLRSGEALSQIIKIWKHSRGGNGAGESSPIAIYVYRGAEWFLRRRMVPEYVSMGESFDLDTSRAGEKVQLTAQSARDLPNGA